MHGKPNFWLYLPIGALVGLVLLLAGALGLSILRVPDPVLGAEAPALVLADLYRPEAVVDLADYRGEPVLVNVWASWCVTCRHEHATLRRLAALGVPIIGVNFRDTRDAALDYLQQGGDPFVRVGMDPRGRALAPWGVHATPVTFLIDAEGRVRFQQVGRLSPERVANEILPLFRRLQARDEHPAAEKEEWTQWVGAKQQALR